MRTITSPGTEHIDPAVAPDQADTTADRRRERGRGQALVEFAIVLPVFFLVVAGMFDLGLGVYSDLTLVNAAREGARLGVIDPGNTSAVESRVRAMSTNLDDSKLSVSVTCEREVSGTFVPCTGLQWLPGDATRVKVDYQYSVFFPVLFGTEIPLSSESRMRIE
mgnify:FL=1